MFHLGQAKSKGEMMPFCPMAQETHKDFNFAKKKLIESNSKNK